MKRIAFLLTGGLAAALLTAAEPAAAQDPTVAAWLEATQRTLPDVWWQHTPAAGADFSAAEHPEADIGTPEHPVYVAELSADPDAGFKETVFGFGSGKTAADLAPTAADVWLKLARGTFSRVTGSTAGRSQEGTSYIEIGREAVVTNVSGGPCESRRTDGSGETVFRGSSLIVLDGQVECSAAGGLTSIDGQTARFIGDTTLLVRSCQTTNTRTSDYGWGRFLGGSLYRGSNAASGARHTGSTSLVVELPEGTEGTFNHDLVGGSYCKGTADWTIDGSTSVTVRAPDTVSFVWPVYGASVDAALKDGGTATVTGDSTVILEGGTYSKEICAAGYGARSVVKGRSRLILRGGSFAQGSVLSAANKNAVAEGGSELRIEGRDISFGEAKVNAFDTFTVSDRSSLRLGTRRLPEMTLTAEGIAVLYVTPTPAELTAGLSEPIVGGLADGTVLNRTSVQVVITDSDGERLPAWHAETDDSGRLRISGTAHDLSWNTPAESEDWTVGFVDTPTGTDNVSFGSNLAPATVRFGSAQAAASVSVAGDYTFVPAAGTEGGPAALPRPLTAASVTVGRGGRLNLGRFPIPSPADFRCLRVEFTERNHDITYATRTSVAEFGLLCNGRRVSWPETLTVTDLNADPDKSRPGHLTDGIRKAGNTTMWMSKENIDLSRERCYFTLDAGEGRTFGFDGYVIDLPVTAAQNPRAWRLSGSDRPDAPDEAWTVLDRQTLTQDESTSLTAPITVSEAAVIKTPTLTVAAGGILTGCGTVAGNAVFEDGSLLEPSPDGVLTVTGTVTATAPIRVRIPDALKDFSSLKLLNTPTEGLTFSDLPEGSLIVRADGEYLLLRPDTAVVSGNGPLSGLTIRTGRGDCSWQDWIANVGAGGALRLDLPADATLTVDVPATLAGLIVGGTGSLILDGDVPLTTDILCAETDVTDADGLLRPASAELTGDAVLSCGFHKSGSLWPLCGQGTFVKTGKAECRVGLAAEPGDDIALDIREGTLRFADTAQDKTVFARRHCITVRSGATLALGIDYRRHLRFANTENVVTLCGGAVLDLGNGAYNGKDYGKMPMTVRILEAETLPARIQGAIGGSYATLCGRIVGESAAAPQQLVLKRYSSNPWNISGTMEGNLAVSVTTSTKDGKDLHPAVHFLSAVPYSLPGGLSFACDYSLDAKDSAVALSDTDITVAEGKTLTLGQTLTVGAGRTLTLPGRLGGTAAPVFADGAVLNITRGLGAPLSGATVFNGRWTVHALDSQITEEGLLLVAGADAQLPEQTRVQTESVPAVIVRRDDGLWLTRDTVPQPTVPDIVLPDGGTAVQPQTAEAVQQALADSLGDRAAAVKTVNLVPGTDGKQPLTSADAENALAVFGSSIATVTAEGNTATVTVGYTFGVTDIAVDAALRKVTFTASVTDGSLKPAALAKDATISLFRGEEKIQTLEKMDGGSVRFTVDLEERAPLYKVRAERN